MLLQVLGYLDSLSLLTISSTRKSLRLVSAKKWIPWNRIPIDVRSCSSLWRLTVVFAEAV